FKDVLRAAFATARESWVCFSEPMSDRRTIGDHVERRPVRDRAMRPIPILVCGLLVGAVAAAYFLDVERRTDAPRSSPGDAPATDVARTRAALSHDPEVIGTKEGLVERNSAQVGSARTQEDTEHSSSSLALEHDVAAPIETNSQTDTTHAFAPDSKSKSQAISAFPVDAETKIWDVLSANQHLNFTSIDRIVCRPTICEIRYTGGPDLSDSGPQMSLLLPLSNALPMIKSAWMSSRVELSPGVFSSVFTIRSTIGNDLLEEYQIGKP
ncbi:MAG: hypothetical protein ACRETU_07670, partial [Steroidobacterales bacterium]